jgi:RNA-directed DNA polymerase
VRLKGEKRQNNQLELALEAVNKGETRKTADKGTEASVAKQAAESPVNTERLMEEVCERKNCEQALKRVKANGGSPGMDGMTVRELPAFLKARWPEILDQLLKGTYKPQPVKRVEIPKPDGGVRKLGIPTVLDRYIQQAVMQVLQGRWDGEFSRHSHGFRPLHSAHQAVSEAQQYIAEGYRHVADIDLEKFFDRVNHDKLMGQVAKRIADKRTLKLIRAFLKAGVMENGLVGPTDEGTPQGGPLSPLLSNLVLDELDRELEKRKLRFVRYADDCNIYVRSRRAGERVMKSIAAFITRKLKLKVNSEKSAVARPWERKFLGFSFTWNRQPKRRIAPKALKRFKEKVRELTSRTRGVSLERMAEELGRYLRGWQGYYGYCQTPSVMAKLEGWAKRRLRSAIWKQWKSGKVRFAELTKRGVDKRTASYTAGCCHGPWRVSNSPALAIALSNAFFESLGLPHLSACR